MTTYSSSERMMGRTPYYPDGFRFLYRPRAQKVYPLEEGGQIHVFTPDECKQYASKIQEYGVAIDQSAFKINYWEARREVVFNVRKDAEVYAAFFEHNDLARVKLLKDSSEKGKEKIWAGAFSRLTTPITDLFNPQEESEEPEVLLKLPFNAYATHEVWEVETDYGPLIVDYLSTIAAESDFVGGGVIGPFLCKQPYKLINPDIFALRAQNGVAPSVVEKADIVKDH